MSTRRSLSDRNKAAAGQDQASGGLTLDERNRAAIAADPDNLVRTEPQAATVSQAPQTPRTAPAVRAGKDRATTAVKRAGDVARMSVYLSAEAFDDARAAYLADWLAGGQIDSLSSWVAAAMDLYAARTPENRDHDPRGRADSRTGAPRSWVIPTDTMARMRAAITEDQKAGHWASDSAWCAAAIAAAVESSRQRDGQLPTPPPRLPKRLTR